MSNRGPFTTSFDPPSSCASVRRQLYATSLSGIPGVILQGPLQLGPCWPANYAGEDGEYFSPAPSCPVGYTTAATSVYSIGQARETAATCCPEAWGELTYRAGHQVYGGCHADVVSRTLVLSGVSPVVGGVTSQGIDWTLTAGAVNAASVQVRFQAGDLSTMTTTTGSGGLSTSTTTGAAGPTGSNGSSDSSSSGPSTGAKAGIGVGVAAAVLILLGIVAFLFITKRRRARSAAGGSSGGGGPPAELLAVSPGGQKSSQHGGSSGLTTQYTGETAYAPTPAPPGYGHGGAVHEMPGSHAMAELSGDYYPPPPSSVSPQTAGSQPSSYAAGYNQYS